MKVELHAFWPGPETEREAGALLRRRNPRTLGSPYPWGTLPGPHVPQWARPCLP